jgi:hypothetical protein
LYSDLSAGFSAARLSPTFPFEAGVSGLMISPTRVFVRCIFPHAFEVKKEIPVNMSINFYTDPVSGSMILQLLLGGAGGIYVIVRMFKQKILRAFGIGPPDPEAASHASAPKGQNPGESE